jgi:nitrate reductase (NAD(P)H)
MLMVSKGLETVQRPYTPIHTENTGALELIIKIYSDGKFTSILDRAKPGAIFKCRGPIRENHIADLYLEKSLDDFFYICSGTGITPALLMIDYLFSKSLIVGKYVLLASFQTDEDIISDDRLQQAEARYQGKLKVIITVGRAKPTWTGLVGPVTTQMISNVISSTRLECFTYASEKSSKDLIESYCMYSPSPKKAIRVAVCGKSKFCSKVKESMKQLGYPYDAVTIL